MGREHVRVRVSPFLPHTCQTNPPTTDTDHLSPKSDIWSFGLSLWALATGQFPYEEAIQDEFDLRMASE